MPVRDWGFLLFRLVSSCLRSFEQRDKLRSPTFLSLAHAPPPVSRLRGYPPIYPTHPSGHLLSFQSQYYENTTFYPLPTIADALLTPVPGAPSVGCAEAWRQEEEALSPLALSPSTHPFSLCKHHPLSVYHHLSPLPPQFMSHWLSLAVSQSAPITGLPLSSLLPDGPFQDNS